MVVPGKSIHLINPGKKGLPARSASIVDAVSIWVSWCARGQRGGKELTVLLEVCFARSGELNGSKLESPLFEAGDDGADQATLDTYTKKLRLAPCSPPSTAMQ